MKSEEWATSTDPDRFGFLVMKVCGRPIPVVAEALARKKPALLVHQRKKIRESFKSSVPPAETEEATEAAIIKFLLHSADESLVSDYLSALERIWATRRSKQQAGAQDDGDQDASDAEVPAEVEDDFFACMQEMDPEALPTKQREQFKEFLATGKRNSER